MTAAARVSVVVTCFNHAHYLTDALASVFAQTYPHIDVVVVDDGSTDNTEAVATGFSRTRYVRQRNNGLAAARNAGIEASRGEFLLFLDADDRLLPTAIETGLRQFADHPDCAFVAGNHRIIGFDGSVLWEHSVGPEDNDLYCALLRRNFIAMHAAVLYQRLVFDSVGGFDGRYWSTEDYDLYLRVTRRFLIKPHTVVVAEYRRHGTNMTRNASRVLRSALLALDNQRQQGFTAQMERSYLEGVRFVRRYYGGEIAKQLPVELKTHEWRRAASSAVTLLRHYPGGFWNAVSS